MKVAVQKSFEKDISKIKNKLLAQKILSTIEELETFGVISDIPHLKKLKGEGNYYRIRIGEFRLGFKIEKDTIVLLRIMARKDIYKYFP